MMNIVAMWMLLSSLGAVMVLSPEPILTNPGQSSHLLKAAKDASRQSVEYAADAARKTGEAIRQTVASGMHSTGDLANSAMDAVKDTSQSGLEKIGLATPEKSTFEQWESGLQAAKDKAAAATRAPASDTANEPKLSAQEKYDNLKKYGRVEAPSTVELAKEKYENLKKYGQLEPPSTTEFIKDKAESAYGTTKEAAGDAATAVKDTVVGAGEKIQEGAEYTYQSAEEAAAAAKHRLENAVGSLREKSRDTLGEEKSSESSESVNELASRIAQSVQDNVNEAGSKAYDTAGSAKDSTYETMGTAYEYAADALKNAGEKASEVFQSGEESDPSYKEKLKMATEQAADILRKRAKDAANYMPNVGQGLSMGATSDSDLQKKASEYKDKATNWRESFLNKVGIREEADLSKVDVMVGNIKTYWSGRDWTGPGLFQSDAATGSQHAKSVKDKVSDSIHHVADHLRHAKDSVVGKAKHMRGAASDAAHEPTDGAKDRAADAVGHSGFELNDTASATSKHGGHYKESWSSVVRWMAYATVGWIFSSIKAAHLLSFSFTYGTSLWVTFVSGYVLSKSLPRQQYGSVQSKMFPTYLRLIGVGQAACLVLYMILNPWTRSSSAGKLQHFNLWIVLISTLINIFFLEPRSTKTMFEKLKIEREEGSRAEEEAAKAASDLREGTTSLDGHTKANLNEINQKFSLLHGWSSTFNLLGLLGETWHLWHLSRALAV